MAKMAAGLALLAAATRTRDVMEIIGEDSEIGVAEIDRGSSVWDPTAGEDGNGDFVHVPDVTPELAIDLVANEGKGYGGQTIAQVDLGDAVAALQEIVAADFARPGNSPEEYSPPADVIRASWRMVFPKKEAFNDKGKRVLVSDEAHPEGRCMVSFRVKGGRGAKPAVIHRDRLTEVITLLTGLDPAFEQREELAWDNYEKVVAAKQAAAAAEAAANADDGSND